MSIKIDLKIFLFALIYIITKQIKIYAILMLFALIHELGHLVTGLILGLKIEEISVVPVGFSIRFKTESKDYNKSKSFIIKKDGHSNSRTNYKFNYYRNCSDIL